MKKILLSLFSIGVVAIVAVLTTQAFFSDEEVSKDNILQAGAIDLKVDNQCYYNGRLCRLQPDGTGIWEGTEEEECTCSWKETDLTTEKFFELTDIKPGDWEEDTISLRVRDNEAWLCADVHLTSDDDVDCTDPETADDANCDPLVDPDLDNADGDLADEIRFLWWADDGDNVLETCTDPQDPTCVQERPLPSGPLGALNVSQTAHVTLADSLFNIWGQQGPVPADGRTWYIGKAWCFGDITPDPVAEDRGTPGDPTDDDNRPNTPTNADDPTKVTPEDGGFNCDGSGVNNAAQTDRLTADIGFRAVQSRNNEKFVCDEQAGPQGT